MKSADSSPLKSLDPIGLVRTVLAERCRKNPSYSIRAFARSSGISHTVLSLALSGKRRLSKKAALQLADYLELNPEHKEALLRHYLKGGSSIAYKNMDLDSFEVISDWYHYAILSALELPDSKFEARWIAKQLSITVLEAKLAMERLQRLNLVGQDKTGRWKQSAQPFKIENLESTAATRKFHKQLLKRAVESIDLNKINERDFSSMTFAMDPTLISYAAPKIKKFLFELSEDLEQKGTPGAVYNMTIQLFPVTPLPQPQKMEKK